MSTFANSYLPGEHVAVILPDAAVMGAQADLARLLDIEGEPASALHIINTLASGDLRKLPEFAAVLRSGDDLVLLVRGGYECVSEGVTVDGIGTSTWTERRLPGAALRPVEIGVAGTASTTTGILPIAIGVVLATRVTAIFLPTAAFSSSASAMGAPPEAGSDEAPEPLEMMVAPEVEAAPLPTVIAPEVSSPALEQVLDEATPDLDDEPPADLEEQPLMSPPAVEIREEPDPGATLDEFDDDFDAMFHTVHGFRPEDAAVKGDEDAGSDSPVAGPTGEIAPPPAAPGTPDVSDADLGDHDGRTITNAELQRLRETSGGEVSSPPAAGFAAPSRVSARLEISDGRVVPVDSHVVIGRRPRAHQTHGAQLPSLIVLEDPYLSKTHVEVLIEGVVVSAIDRSTNGTFIQTDASELKQLDKDVPTALSDGTVLVLSDDVQAVVRIQDAGAW